MKGIIQYFIKYPVAVNIVILGFAIFGFLGIKQMKSSFFPLSESRNINISVVYPGASPIEMEEGIVLKIEDNLKGLVGVKEVTSASSENSARITVEGDYGVNMDELLFEVKNAVDRVPSFPSGMEPPVVSKTEAVQPAYNFIISGNNIPLATLKSYARNIENDLRAFPTISQISLSGFPDEEIEIALSESDLRAFNLTFDEVSNAIATTNIITTGGRVKTTSEEYLIRGNNRSYFGDELGQIVVRASSDGKVIRLKDVATIRDRWNEDPNRLFANQDEAIQVSISVTNQEDMIAVCETVDTYITEFNNNNQNIELITTLNFAEPLEERIGILAKNGLQGVFLVMIFLSLFLKPRLAFWVAVGLPVSFLGMFMILPFMGVTINVMSIFGMIIVIGILVDDGIVIGENIYYHFEQGKTPIRAAIDGTMEVMPPIVSAILTTIAAFTTFVFLKSDIGIFFGEVAIVVFLTLGVSLIEALIILPAHIAHSKGLSKDKEPYLLNKYADRLMVWLRETIYLPLLTIGLKNKFLAIVVPIAMLMLTIGSVMGGIIGVTFFPRIASDRVTINFEMPKGTSEQVTDSISAEIEKAAFRAGVRLDSLQSGDKHVIRSVIRTLGPGSSSASIRLALLQGEQREVNANTVSRMVEEEMGPIYGAESIVYGAGTQFGGAPISFSLVGSNIVELKAAKKEVKERMLQMSELKDVEDNDPAGIKEIKLELKESAYLLGLNFSTVMSQVRSGFFGREVQRFQRGQDEIKVWVRYAKDDRASIKSLDEMRILTPSGQRVALSEIASYEIERGEIDINHLDGKRQVTLSSDTRDPKASSTAILANLKENILPGIMAKYSSVAVVDGGQSKEAGELAASAAVVFPIVLFLIFAIIAFTFRSYSQPFLLLAMVPLSLIGVAWGHWLHGFQISMLSALGIIALIGIMVNDGLVLIGKFNSFLRTGMSFDDALYEAGKSRFRAIFLTSITTAAGLSPLILEKSRGAQFLIPMAISLVYGIIIATFLTLFVLPLLLSISNQAKRLIKRVISGQWPTREEVERPVKEKIAQEEAMAALSA